MAEKLTELQEGEEVYTLLSLSGLKAQVRSAQWQRLGLEWLVIFIGALKGQLDRIADTIVQGGVGQMLII